MMKIRINEFRSVPVRIYGPDGSSIGLCNNINEFLDLRVQIAREQVSGYSFWWKGKEIKITEDGELEYEGELEGFYDATLNLTMELRRIQKSRDVPNEES